MRKGPTLLWRTLHHPHRHNYTPFPVRDHFFSYEIDSSEDSRAHQVFDLAASLQYGFFGS